MTYSTLLEDENSRQRYLAILTPRRQVSGFSLVSGFIYKATFSQVYGRPVRFEFDGVEMTEVTTSTVDASEWYYDEDTFEIYFRAPQSGDPDTEGLSVAFYNLYCATFDAYWFSDPLDDTTDVTYFEPIIQKEPEIKSSTTDNIFGFLPTQTSSISLINTESFLDPHIYDSSFNGASIKIYHTLKSELEVANIKLVYDGLMSDVSYNGINVSIKTTDRIDIFSKEWRNADTSFFSTDDFPNLNPTFIGKPIRYVYGYVRGFQPVNIDYVADDIRTTSDNRDWVVVAEQTGLSEIVRTVPATPSSTTTRTYVNFAEGLMVGDTVFLDGATDYYVVITAVNFTSDNYIEHAAIAAPMATGEFIKKGFVSRVEITQNNVVYTAMYGRDYTIGNFAVGTRGITFSSSLEANLSIPETLSSGDTVSCYVYGRVNDLVADSNPFGENDQRGTERSFNLANAVMITYDVLKNKLSIPESEINIDQFIALHLSTRDNQALGFAIPDTASGGFPNYKTIISKILETSLFRIFVDNDNKWTLEQLAPLGSSAFSIDDFELQGFSYEFNYNDIVSDVIVNYQTRDIPDQPAYSSGQSKTVMSTSTVAQYVHKVEKQRTFLSAHFKEADATLMANRLSYILGERQGLIKFSAKKRLFGNIINDTMTVNREKLPGFQYASGTENSREFSITATTKSLKGVSIEANDQLGIQNNEGDW